jgi:hypothetical protein
LYFRRKEWHIIWWVTDHDTTLPPCCAAAHTSHVDMCAAIQYIRANHEVYGFSPDTFMAYYVVDTDPTIQMVIDVFDDAALALFYLSLQNG